MSKKGIKREMWSSLWNIVSHQRLREASLPCRGNLGRHQPGRLATHWSRGDAGGGSGRDGIIEDKK